MKARFTLLVALCAATLSLSAYAGHYGTAGCGLGAMVFKDKPGMIQIVAATLNGVMGSQTFGMTSGTSNCKDHDSGEVAELFININKDALQKDIARGQGETLENLSKIYECSDVAGFNQALQTNYRSIFPKANVEAKEVRHSIESALKNGNAANGCKVLG